DLVASVVGPFVPSYKELSARDGAPRLVCGRQPLLPQHERSHYARHFFNSGAIWNLIECKSRARLLFEKRNSQSCPREAGVHSCFHGSVSARKSTTRRPRANPSCTAKYVRSLNGDQVGN